MIVILMGVSGSGKTTVGRLLAEKLGWEFVDADTFHSPQNIAKMRHGEPLTDADRALWLAAVRTAMKDWTREHRNLVLACSALKSSYRDQIAGGLPDVKWVWLSGSFDVISARLSHRHGHFMPATLLRSQFDSLMPPTDAIVVSVDQAPEQVARAIQTILTAPPG